MSNRLGTLRQRPVECIGSEVGPIRPDWGTELVDSDLLKERFVPQWFENWTEEALRQVHLARNTIGVLEKQSVTGPGYDTNQTR